ncbi:hypothetical protein [Parabacteroides johnsonii]|uniref:hypothetical protein n=1 Tax=Parabacteroides johnsonii TaxID=387661 RepID=UPI0011DD42DD|nr:hypothetical protein [Parabacteroides johnsonii]
MSNIKLFESCPINKSDQNDLANRLINTVLDGDINLVEATVKAKSLIEVLTKFVNDDRVKDCTLSEIEKNGKETSWNGARLAIKEVGVKYDYSDCNDPVYMDLLKQKEVIDKQLKERESFLKSLSNRTTIVDDETGEVATVIPPVKMSSQGYTITFSK